jgi:hypothetical protein
MGEEPLLVWNKGQNGAVGDGPTPEAVIADLREALEVLLAETGLPDELTLALNVA